MLCSVYDRIGILSTHGCTCQALIVIRPVCDKQTVVHIKYHCPTLLDLLDRMVHNAASMLDLHIVVMPKRITQT